MRNYLFLFFLFFLSLPGTAQQLNFSNIGSAIKFPSEEGYNIIQDSKGYIWVCTENGLCRYNGSSLKVFDKHSGLPENSVYYIGEDNKGVVRMITSKNRILHIEGDSLVEEKCSKSFCDFLQTQRIPFIYTAYFLSVDEHGDFIVNGEYNTLKIDHTTCAVTNMTAACAESDANLFIMAQKNKNYLVKARFLTGVDYDRGAFDFNVDFVGDQGTKRIRLPFEKSVFPDWRIKMCRSGNETFFYVHNKVIRVDEQLNYTVTDFPGTILSIHCDKDNGLWVGLFQKGVYYYSNKDQLVNPVVSLSGYSVTGITMDREGGTWCTTLESSIFYCSNRYLLDYSGLAGFKKPASLLKSVGGNVFIATQTDSYILLKDNKPVYYEVPGKRNMDITDAFYYNSQWYFSSNGYVAYTDRQFRVKGFVKSRLTKSDVCVFQMDTLRGKLYGVVLSTLFVINNDTAIIERGSGHSKTRTLLTYNDSCILLGHLTGISLYNVLSGKQTDLKGISAPVKKTTRAASGKIWIATKGGLFTLENEKIQKVNFGNVVHSDIFLDVQEDKNGNIWAVSSNELLRISGSGINLKVRKYDVSTGLLSDNLKRIAVTDEGVFISTSKGICHLPLNSDLTNTVAPPVFINAVTVNGRAVNHTDNMCFPHNENSFDFYFDALTYKKGEYPILLYKLIGQDDSLHTSSQPELHFENLPPNDYTLLVYAVNNSGLKSAVPVMYTFRIEKPYWQTAWFIGICILVFFSILFFSVRKIIRNVKQREEEKTRINKLVSESQLSALQAQMNPHFIFNAINSIQNYILKKEEKEAYDYLAKFSKLIRIVLNNSRESTLSLSQELETLNLYIELEKLRFKNSFEFILTVDEEINGHEVNLPAMLIQPYVENAIWHGLMNLDDERERILKLDFSIENNLLKIVVQDNGIGRSRSYEYKRESVHNPVGMKLTEQRLTMINRIKDYEGIRVAIIDLYDAEGNAAGTKVELFLPLTI